MLIVVVLSLSLDLRTYEFGSGDLPPMFVRWVDFNNLLDSFTFRVVIDLALIELLDAGVIRHNREKPCCS